MPLEADELPALSQALTPPTVLGTADLTDFAYQGHDHDSLIARIDRARPTEAAGFYDRAIACQLAFRRAEGLDLLDEALARSQMFRIGGRARGHDPLRVLALVGAGDLMVNTPLDFITNGLDVRLDLLYVLPDRPLPAMIPDHDVAFFALGEANAAMLRRLRQLFDAWPRPALNDPKYLPLLQRDTLSRALAGAPGIRSPAAVRATRTEIEDMLRAGAGGHYPRLIRPASSHAGIGLFRADTAAALWDYLQRSFERDFFLTAFEDYRGADGLYRKSRVAFIDRQPFLCHLAVSEHWMVHYLNAGMTESAQKRDWEAAAMADFDHGFARRHGAAFAALHQRLGFDYYTIDCAETTDGQLLVFEADAAAIIHLMDPPDLFPYKQSQMRRVFDAFGAMLRRRAGSRV